jgi:UDP-2,3-diacylglucosamine pyrophosphatase LpxH
MAIPSDSVVFIPDLHVPYHDKRAVSAAQGFLARFQPSFLFFLGDACDFYQTSRYDTNPARIYALQEDIDATWLVIHGLRTIVPKAKAFFICGNHERRMQKRLWRRLPEGASLRCLEVDRLLSLESLGVEFVKGGVMDWRGLIVKHGHFTRGKAGYSASAEMERTWSSGVSGHTHRLAVTYYSGVRREAVWMECGCLAQIKQEWHEGQHMNQRHGIGFGWVSSRGAYEFHALPIDNGRIRFQGEEIVP